MPEKFESEVLETREVAPGVKICRFSTPDSFEFKAGQFVLICFKKDGKPIRRAYSIASQPNKKEEIELCIKKVPGGIASNYICDLKKGDKTEIFGPAGGFTIKEQSKGKDLCFIATGTGITPFVSIINDLLENGFKNKIYLVHGYRYEEDKLYENEFKTLDDKYDNFKVFTVLSKPHNACPYTGHVQDFFKDFNILKQDTHYYICGLTKMIDCVLEDLKKAGINEDSIFYEKYD